MARTRFVRQRSTTRVSVSAGPGRSAVSGAVDARDAVPRFGAGPGGGDPTPSPVGDRGGWVRPSDAGRGPGRSAVSGAVDRVRSVRSPRRGQAAGPRVGAACAGASRCWRRCRPRGVLSAGLAGPGVLGWWGGLESLVPVGRCGWVRLRRRRVRLGRLGAGGGVGRAVCCQDWRCRARWGGGVAWSRWCLRAGVAGSGCGDAGCDRGVSVLAAVSAARCAVRSTWRRPPVGRGGPGQRVGASPGPGSSVATAGAACVGLGSPAEGPGDESGGPEGR